MFFSKLKVAALIILGLGMVGTGTGMLATGALQRTPVTTQAEDAVQPPREPPIQPGRGEAGPAAAGGEGSVKAPKDPLSTGKQARELRMILNQPTEKLKNGIDPGTPLFDALESIGQLHDIIIRIDKPAFLAAGVSDIGERPVVVPPTRGGVSLGILLRDMLGQIGPVNGRPIQATYLVRGNHIVVVPTVEGTNMVDPVVLFWQLINVEFEKRPLDEALRELSDMTGVTIVLDIRAGDEATSPVAGTFQNVPLETAVRLLADMAGLKSVAVDNVLYVTSKANADAMETDQQGRQERNVPSPFTPRTPAGAM